MSAFRKWITKNSEWEYWPFWVFNFPVNFYFIWLAIRAKSFFFFSTSNPTIDLGGMIGEKKSQIFDLIPEKFYPKTFLAQNTTDYELKSFGRTLGYPLVAKPDIGERGNLVEVIRNEEQLLSYQKKVPVPFLLQEFVDYPIELGVFYIRKPLEEYGLVTSIVQKKFLSVMGDGTSDVQHLLSLDERAQRQVDITHHRLEDLLEKVPTKGEEVVVEPIGNHSRGTMFLDVTKEADKKLSMAFDKLAKQIDGFYYGRFDLKCNSIEELRELRNFSILELNGAGAEPAHIYHPGFSLIEAYRVVFRHYKLMAEISSQNKSRGFSYLTLKEGLRKLFILRNYNKRLKNV